MIPMLELEKRKLEPVSREQLCQKRTQTTHKP